MKLRQKEEDILIAGAGGQGIIFLGKLIALAATEQGYNVTFFRSYGAEMRGGTAVSMVRASCRQIPSPYIECPTVFICLNQPSFIRYKDRLSAGSLAVLNSSLIDKENIKILEKKKVKAVSGDFLQEAARINSLRSVNIIALSLALKTRPVVPKQVVRNIIQRLFSSNPQALNSNLLALDAY